MKKVKTNVLFYFTRDYKKYTIPAIEKYRWFSAEAESAILNEKNAVCIRKWEPQAFSQDGR